MSTIRNFDDALDFFPAPKRARPLAKWFAGVRRVFAALNEGLTACRRYQDLTARGVPHATAVETVFADHYSAR